MTRILNMIRHHVAPLIIMAAAALTIPASAMAEDYSAEQLKSFVMAELAINEIAEKWRPQVEAAENEDQATGLLQQFEQEAGQAVENTDGIDINEYLKIRAAKAEDPALNSQIEGMMQEMNAN